MKILDRKMERAEITHGKRFVWIENTVGNNTVTLQCITVH